EINFFHVVPLVKLLLRASRADFHLFYYLPSKSGFRLPLVLARRIRHFTSFHHFLEGGFSPLRLGSTLFTSEHRTLRLTTPETSHFPPSRVPESTRDIAVNRDGQ